jgi:hypothetical protein
MVEAQVDWGAFGSIRIGHGTRPLSGFVMVLSYSRALSALFTLDQTLESFLRGHVEAFHDGFGGVAEVDIECEDDARVRPSTRDHFSVRRPLHRERSDVGCFVPELTQEIDGERGQACIGQEPHRSRAKRVKLILRQRRGVHESLPNVFLVEVWEIGDDLRRRHAVGDEVDDMGH